MESFHELNINTSESMSCWSKKIQANMNSIIRNGHSVDTCLSL